ncbi:SRPBCC family protein [Robertkochia flava]|uniref:SRPBCC family protein n=1 Tax=Robertkochia flava TaxID=3447986 RepID=UPI001CD00C55|nr:SRPBCC family protein [Robertkochia marina]
MKYELSIEIERPTEEVLELLMDPENLKHWQKGLICVSHLDGVPGKKGCKSKLKYQIGKRKMTLTETITKVDQPRELHLDYQTNGVLNFQRNYFIPTENGTLWKSESEFRFTNIYMKVMGFLMPSAFKKQSRDYMKDFKNFAEKGVTVHHETH